MLFSIGITLMTEEIEQLREVVHPCHACLGLENDYFSFDRDYMESNPSGGAKLINAVWLFMQWRGFSITEAEKLVKDATNQYEGEYLVRVQQYKATRSSVSPKLDKYREALLYMVSGNAYWSLNCTRYNLEFRYDINAVIARRDRDSMSAQSTKSSASGENSPLADTDQSASPVSSAPTSPRIIEFCFPQSQRLGSEVSHS
jgi:hypothetical protein